MLTPRYLQAIGTIFIIIWACGAWAAEPPQTPISEARALLGQFRETVRTLQSGGADQAKAQEQMASAMKDLEKIRALFELGGAADSNDADALQDYADVLRSMGDTDLAVKALERAVHIEPNAAKAWLSLGENEATLGSAHAPNAQRALRQAATLLDTPRSDDERKTALSVHRALGRLYYENGLYDLSRQAFLHAHELAPDDAEAHVGLAMLDVRDGKILDASNALDAINADSFRANMMIGQMLDPALDAFDESRRWFPDTAQDNAAYAKLLIRANRINQSVPPMERAVKLDPNQYVYWNLLASVNRPLNNVSRMREAYEHSLALNPNQPFVQEALAQLANTN